MTRRFTGIHIIPLSVFAICLTATLTAASANGLVRYVSINGNNANNCLLATPCRTLQKGINVTPAGGELRVLESGNYTASATVNRSMTISGVQPDVTLSQMSLTIDDASAVVSLRNLHLAGGGASGNGITIAAATQVNIEHVVIQGYAGSGISKSTGTPTLQISDSIIRGNGAHGISFIGGGFLNITRASFTGNGANGIIANVNVRATLSHVTSTNQAHGMYVAGTGAQADISNSIFQGNAGMGIHVYSSGTARLDSTILKDNGTGIVVDASATALLSNVMITSNTTGISNNGTINTRANNILEGNTTGVSGTGSTNLITTF